MQKARGKGSRFLILNNCSLNAPIHYYSSTALLNNIMVLIPPCGSSDRGDGGSTGKEEKKEEKIPVGDKEVNVIGMERKQMIVDVLVLPLLSPKPIRRGRTGKTRSRSRGGCY